jgi:putative membrane protein
MNFANNHKNSSNMKKVLVSVFIIGTLLASCGNNDNESKKEAMAENKEKFDSTLIQDDTKFAVAAADGSMMEVQLGKLALSNGSSKKVKSFAQMMIDDHSKAGDELNKIAASKNISLPATISNKNQDSYNDLAGKKGADFDKAYTSFMLDDHKDAIDAFSKESENGKDNDLKNWATGKIPVLQHHLMMAQSADSSVRKSN